MRAHRAVPHPSSVPTARPRGRRGTLVLALAACAALLLGGCSASGDDAGADAGGAGAMPAPAGPPQQAEAADKGADSAGGTVNDGATSSGERMVVVSGTVTVVVKDPIEAAGEVADLVEKVGGFVSARQQQSTRGETQGWATLTARIPAADLQDVIAQLEDVGRVDATELTSTEVTAQAKDLDARIKALQLSIDRLTDLLARSGDLEDIVQAEQVLTDRQSQLEELQSQRAALADEVSMSTVEIRLYQEDQVAAPTRGGFLGGLSSGWHALVSFLGGLVTVLGALLPWLAVAAVVTAAVWPLVRRSRRRAAERAAAFAAAHPAPASAAAYQYLARPVPAGPGPAGPPAAPPVPPAPPVSPAAEERAQEE